MFSKFLSLEPERRNAILNAALKEFAGKGFDDASTNVIAKEASISKPLMFHYVNNKKDFFLFLYIIAARAIIFSKIIQKRIFSTLHMLIFSKFGDAKHGFLTLSKVFLRTPKRSGWAPQKTYEGGKAILNGLR